MYSYAEEKRSEEETIRKVFTIKLYVDQNCWRNRINYQNNMEDRKNKKSNIRYINQNDSFCVQDEKSNDISIGLTFANPTIGLIEF